MYEPTDAERICAIRFTMLPSIAMRSISLALTLGIAQIGVGQVHLDRSLELNGSSSADRQVIGLDASNQPNTALSVKAQRASQLVHADAIGGSIWTVDIPAYVGPPVAGTHITVRVPDNATGPVSMLLNGLGPYSVVTGPIAILQGEEIPSGAMLSLVFTGSVFQLMNGEVRTLRPCPAGSVAANGQFCIDTQQNATPSDWFVAAADCGARGMRLCSWAEYHVACSTSGALGLAGMVGDWEWIGSACNEDGSARIVGGSACASTACALATGNTDRIHRCCADR